ncbi:MAG: ribonuclease D [Anaerolineae bacterium]|nr:ribonuclease D [Anaerolineae bacterium]
MSGQLSPAAMITAQADLARYADTWAREPLLAIDTESNSLYAYREQVCLIQLSTREQDFIIDPLVLDHIDPLGDLIADPGIEKVFHAAEYDVMCLKRDFAFTFTNLFDTMIAARICGSQKLGLANMLEEYFSVAVDKKYQRANWGRRPLEQDMLRYAQLDTHYLPDLRDIWQAQLQEHRRWREAQEVFAELTDLPAAAHSFDPDGFWRINGAQALKPHQMSVLRALYLLREEIAEQRNYPPFKVFGNKTLIDLASEQPRQQRDLYGITGMTSGQVRRYGRHILQAVAAAKQDKPPRRPQRDRRPSEAIVARYEALHEWRKQRAQQRGVESDVIVTRDALWALARHAPATPEELADVPGLGPWKTETYGAEILRVLAAADNRNGRR